MLTEPTTAAARVCDYCGQAAEGPMVRVNAEDPTTRRVALAHPACRALFAAEVTVWSVDEDGLPVRPAVGVCHLCGAHTPAGRVIREIHSDSGGGMTVVRCLACCEKPPVVVRAHRPRTYSR